MTEDDDLALAPAACTLPVAERPLRLAEFDDLFSSAVRGVESSEPTQARMRLAGPAGLAGRVRDLTGREAGCCTFFTFTVTPVAAGPAGDREVVLLDIAVPEQHAEVLGALVRRARSAARP